jgi:L-lactate permease
VFWRGISNERRLDYFPLISFFMFWFLSGAAGAWAIQDPALLKLGLLTLPALAAVALSAYRLWKRPPPPSY